MTKAREPAAPANPQEAPPRSAGARSEIAPPRGAGASSQIAPPRSAGANQQEEELSFEQILERLESVVETLERGDRPLEEALARFEEGVALSRRGARRLDEAERRIEVLLNDDNGTRTRPLDKDKELTGNE